MNSIIISFNKNNCELIKTCKLLHYIMTTTYIFGGNLKLTLRKENQSQIIHLRGSWFLLTSILSDQFSQILTFIYYLANLFAGVAAHLCKY